MRNPTEPPRQNPASGGVRRGAALTELAICLLPLGLALLGVTLLGHLAMGRHESHKLLAWYMASPDATRQGDLDGRFLQGSLSSAEIPDKASGALPEPAELWEEPVLPYGDSVGGAALDLAVALERSLDRLVYSDGTVGVSDARGVARKFARLGLITNYRSLLGARASLNPDNPSELRMPTVQFEEDAMRTIAFLLGGSRSGSSSPISEDAWLRYSAVRVDAITGGLAAMNLGQAALPLETQGEAVDRFRGDWTLTGEYGQPLVLLEGLVQPEEARLGTHAPGADPQDTIKFSRFGAHIATPEGERVDPADHALMRNPLLPDRISESLWSKTHLLY